MSRQKLYKILIAVILTAGVVSVVLGVFSLDFWNNKKPGTERQPDMGIPVPLSVSSPLGSYDIVSFSLWPESNKLPVLFEDDRITVSGFSLSAQFRTLAIKYNFAPLEGEEREIQDANFLTVGTNGNGIKIISSSTPSGIYKFMAVKVSGSDDWVELKNQPSVKINPISKIILENPIIEYLDLKGGKTPFIKPGDQYAVKVLNGTTRSPLTDAVLDAVYLGPDSKEPQIAERWARLNSQGIGLITSNPNMAKGNYQIISVKIHQ